jgi:glyoxylase-like metal-dependent hydrolase (beta-lactamase superfamily II)
MTAATIVPLECGWLRTQRRTLIDGGTPDEVAIPVAAWLVRHPRGDVLFDAGLHPALADGPDALGPLARLFSPVLEHDGTVGSRLAACDVDPAGPITVVVSHCHFDHVGGLCELPNARLVVHADEWRAALAADGDGYDGALYDLGHDVLAVDGVHDLFGDGSVTTLPTPGHTCGHQSLRVLTPDGPVILAADVCYFFHTLDDGVLPPFGHDLDEHRRSLALLRRERASGTRIVPGHDPAVLDGTRATLD